MKIMIEERETIETGRASSRPPDHNAAISESRVELIRFDAKVKIYIAACLFFYLLFVALKLHNSSIPLWNLNINDGGSEKRGLVAGKTLPVRSDEWFVSSTFILSQQNHHFAVSNEALGPGRTPVLIGLPTKRIFSKLKPALWGYYLLDTERAFSWKWNFKIFPFFITSFLFLMLFTRNNFLISVFGTAWLFLSSAIQWWSIDTDLFTFGLLTIVCLIYILYSDKIFLILLNGIGFFLASYSFAMSLYPAYQVPLAYFLLALVLGFVFSRKSLNPLLDKRFLKASVLGFSLITSLLLVYLYFRECRDMIGIMAHTVYPGKRNETGGGLSFISLFKDNFSWFLGENYFPPKWGNICELSSFLMLSPIVVILVIYSYARTKTMNPLFVPLLIFQLFIYLWLLKGFPEFLSSITLLNTSPPSRTFFVFGFSNVVLTLLYLGQHRKTEHERSPTRRKVAVFILIFIIAFAINYLLNKQSDRFFSIFQIFNAAILFSILNWLIVYSNQRKIYERLFVAGCFCFVASNIFINPLSKGLSPYYENKVYKTVSEVVNKDPGSRWVVFGGGLTAPNFVKAAGANCFNGTEFVPPLEKLHVLDSSLANNDIYNRYAHIGFAPLIDGKDSIKFTLNSPDSYTIQVDPCSPRLKKIGIKYFMFAYKPSEAEVRCMMPVKDTCGFFIYKRTDL